MVAGRVRPSFEGTGRERGTAVRVGWWGGCGYQMILSLDRPRGGRRESEPLCFVGGAVLLVGWPPAAKIIVSVFKGSDGAMIGGCVRFRRDHGGVMANWRVRVATAPLWVVGLYSGITFAGAVGPMIWLGGEGGWAALLGAAFAGPVFAALWMVFVAGMRKRDRAATGPEADLFELYRALIRGEPPTDRSQDTAALALIERRRHQHRGADKANPLVFGGLALLAAFRAGMKPEPLTFVNLLLFVGLLLVVPRLSAREQDRFDRVERALRTRADPPAPLVND